MFEELGYLQIHNNCNYIEYEKMNELCHIKFTFYVRNKLFEKIAFVFEESLEVAPINIEELQAINKQVEELEWNKENKSDESRYL